MYEPTESGSEHSPSNHGSDTDSSSHRGMDPLGVDGDVEASSGVGSHPSSADSSPENRPGGGSSLATIPTWMNGILVGHSGVAAPASVPPNTSGSDVGPSHQRSRPFSVEVLNQKIERRSNNDRLALQEHTNRRLIAVQDELIDANRQLSLRLAEITVELRQLNPRHSQENSELRRRLHQYQDGVIMLTGLILCGVLSYWRYR